MEDFVKTVALVRSKLSSTVPYVGISYVESLAYVALLLWVVYPLLKATYSFLTWFCRRKHFVKGEWAVVTGSTDGIGKAYAKELIKRGMNVMLIARNSEKLEQVKTELGRDGVEIATHTADFCSPDIYPGIEKGG